MGWLTSFLYSQFLITPPVPSKDFTDQAIIVSGANTGLGLEAARHLSRLNTSLLILAVRNVSKGEAAKASILASTHRPESSIEIWPLDMQSTESIKAFVARAERLQRLDAVLANAGVPTQPFKLVEGYESTVMTNVIGTFLLALGVLPKLRESAKKFGTQGRLSIVASDLHFIAKFPERETEDIFEALNDESKADMSVQRYAVTKLIQVYGVRELAGQMSRGAEAESPSVIVNCMTPGFCKSDFSRDSTGIVKIFSMIMTAIVGRSTESGSRTLVAALGAGQESHGQYMADSCIAETGPLVQGPEGLASQKELWHQLIRRLEAIQPGITRNV